MVKLLFVFLCVLIAYINADPIKSCDIGNGQVINVGDSQPEIGTCNIVTCNKDGSFITLTCPPFVVLPPCVGIDGDKTKLYPACCDSAKCPEKH